MRGDEPGWTAAASGRRGQPLRTSPVPAPGRETGHYGSLANHGARLSVVRAQHAPRSHLHRELESAFGSAHPRQHNSRAVRAGRSLTRHGHTHMSTLTTTTLTPTSGALALTRDSDYNPLWRAAGLLLRPLHLGLAFPSVLYVAAMAVFLFRPPDLFSFYADRIAFAVLVFFVALRTLALRDRIPFFAGLSLPMLALMGLAMFRALREPFDPQIWSIIASKYI